MTFLERIKLLRLHLKYRKHENYKTFRHILSKSYMQMHHDLSANAEYFHADMEDELIQRAMVLREAMDTGHNINLLLNPKLSPGQADVILNGLQQGVPENVMKGFANSVYYPEQMQEIITAYQNNISEEQIHSFMKPDFTYEQMREIRQGYENNMPNAHIQIFADPRIHPAVMRTLKTELQNKAKIKDVLELKQKLQVASVSIMRIGLENNMDIQKTDKIIEQMVLLNEYWDNRTCKELTQEICTEINDNNISYGELSDYFSQKFSLTQENPSEVLTPVSSTADQPKAEKTPQNEPNKKRVKKKQQPEVLAPVKNTANQQLSLDKEPQSEPDTKQVKKKQQPEPEKEKVQSVRTASADYSETDRFLARKLKEFEDYYKSIEANEAEVSEELELEETVGF